MAGRLSSKVAIVTGADTGIGQAVAGLFAHEGASVVFAGRSDAAGQALVRKLSASGAEALFVKTDVTKTEDLQYLVSATVDKFGRIDVLVNNAGVHAPRGPETFDEINDYEAVFNVNVKSYLILCREVLPHMIRRKKGSIINTASAVADKAGHGLALFSASTSAIKSFTRSLAGEYADQNIRVNAVVPGMTTADLAPPGGELEQRLVRSIPMGRAAHAGEVAYGFLFFASDESSFCTGTSLVIDGGATAV